MRRSGSVASWPKSSSRRAAAPSPARRATFSRRRRRRRGDEKQIVPRRRSRVSRTSSTPAPEPEEVPPAAPVLFGYLRTTELPGVRGALRGVHAVHEHRGRRHPEPRLLPNLRRFPDAPSRDESRAYFVGAPSDAQVSRQGTGAHGHGLHGGDSVLSEGDVPADHDAASVIVNAAAAAPNRPTWAERESRHDELQR